MKFIMWLFPPATVSMIFCAFSIIRDKEKVIKILKAKIERCEDYKCPPPPTAEYFQKMVHEERLKWLNYIAENYPGVKTEINLIDSLGKESHDKNRRSSKRKNVH